MRASGKLRGTRGQHETKSSAGLIMHSYINQGKICFWTQNTSHNSLQRSHFYTLLNSIWRDKPQYRMQGWATSVGRERVGGAIAILFPPHPLLATLALITGPGSGISHRGWAERRALCSSYITDSERQGFCDCRKVTANRMDPSWSVKGSLLFW